MLSVSIPTLLGKPATGRPNTNKDRTFGSSDYCRALFNYTTASGNNIYMYELQCGLSTDNDKVLLIWSFPTWTTDYADKEITMYFRATASPSVVPGAAGDGAGFLYMNPTQTTESFDIRSHIDMVYTNLWVIDKRTYLKQKVLPLDIPWQERASFLDKGWMHELQAC